MQQVACKVVVTFSNYSILANYSWLLVEGHFLFTQVSRSFFSLKKHFVWYLILGWGMDKQIKFESLKYDSGLFFSSLHVTKIYLIMQVYQWLLFSPGVVSGIFMKMKGKGVKICPSFIQSYII